MSHKRCSKSAHQSRHCLTSAWMKFSAVVAAVQAKREELTTQADHLEASASTAAGSFSSLIVDDLNEEIRQVYDTQRQLERESQLLRAELAAFKHQLSGWSSTTQQLLEGLKHAGDLEHYVAVLSREAAALANVLTAAAQAQAESAATLTTEEETGRASGSIVLGAAAADGVADSAAEVAQFSTEQQPTASAELPVSKRASR
eukprot:GHRQ01009292.1.p1 GENE.GHRQ01009292.1~~GHRQ01009292.1.p1  ORF type:complete len:202 (+),score=74.16 GHRQ01009292.1:598-1203(+)